MNKVKKKLESGKFKILFDEIANKLLYTNKKGTFQQASHKISKAPNALKYVGISPDTNPIENIWLYWNRKRNKLNIKTLKELGNILLDLYDNDWAEKQACKAVFYSVLNRIEGLCRSTEE